jgi:PRTRC genetic system protein D
MIISLSLLAVKLASQLDRFFILQNGGNEMNVGLDLGYSAVKAVSAKKKVDFPSVAGTPDKARFSFSDNSGGIILTSPSHILVGQEAVTQSRFVNRREDRSWIESEEYYHLALAAFTELTKATVAELRIVTGLPVAFYGDKAVLRELLMGEHRATREGRRAQMFKVTDCRVIPQPFGALLAEALDDRGNIADKDLATGNVGVVDVGGKTTNLLSVSRLSEIGRETASVNVGAWDVVRAVRGWLADHCPNLDLRDHQVVGAIIARQVKYYGDPQDLGPVVDAALEPMAEQVIAQATQLWNGGAALDAILVSGGGALLLGPAIRAHFRHAKVVEEPVFANALGYWRFAQHLSQ